MKPWLALLIVLLGGAGAVWASPGEVVVRGLFKNAALLEIDGRSRLMKVGDVDDSGLRLVAASSRSAVVEIDGLRQTLGLNRRVGGQYRAPAQQSVSLHRNLRREYRSVVRINGHRVDALVDTGANLVSMSARQADQLGIKYRNGTPTRVSTASGVTQGYRISLDRVELAGIIRHHVEAVVIEGDFPRDLLLGMSFLEHLNMREQDNILTLQPRYP